MPNIVTSVEDIAIYDTRNKTQRTGHWFLINGIFMDGIGSDDKDWSRQEIIRVFQSRSIEASSYYNPGYWERMCGYKIISRSKLGKLYYDVRT